MANPETPISRRLLAISPNAPLLDQLEQLLKAHLGSDALNRLLLIRFASEMGFTLAEIKVFLSGLRSDVPVGPRWRKLAHHKIKQADASIKRSRQLKSLLEHLLQCRCPSLPVCVQRLSLSPTLQKLQGSSLGGGSL